MPRKLTICVCASIPILLLSSLAAFGQSKQKEGAGQPSSSSSPSVLSPITQKPISDLTAKELLRLRDDYQEQEKKLLEDIDKARELNNDLSTFDKQPKQYQEILRPKITTLADSLGLVESDPTKSAMRTEAQQKGHKLEEDLDTAEKNRKDAESELANRTDLETAQQNFKKITSSIFAAIVGMVIVGFFVVAVLDEQVRQEIFAGQAGIQFITLFSLVIAIILFGITGVLEGKELAALLGGLAGYILGRSGVPSSSAAKQSADETKEKLGKNSAQT